MRKINCIYFMSLVAFLWLASQAEAQCCRCSGGIGPACFCNCRGAIACPTNCNAGCICTSPQVAYLDQLHPGFVTAQVGGHSIVSGVVGSSGAENGGIRSGDEIVSVNAADPVESCEGPIWGNSSRPVALVVVRRGKFRVPIKVALVPVRQLLERAWKSKSIQNVSLASTSAKRWPDLVYGPYTIGVVVDHRSGAWVISDVLNGSPAEVGGVIIGDRILAVNGRQMHDTNDFAKFVSSDQRFSVTVLLQRGNAAKTVQLRSIGSSQLLQGIAKPTHISPTNIAALDVMER